MPQAVNPPPMETLDWKGQGVTIAQVLDALTEFRHRSARAMGAGDAPGGAGRPAPRQRRAHLSLVAGNAALWLQRAARCSPDRRRGGGRLRAIHAALSLVPRTCRHERPRSQTTWVGGSAMGASRP